MRNLIRDIEREKLQKVFMQDVRDINRLDALLSKLSSDCGLDYKNIMGMLRKRQKYVAIPAALFNNALAPLENVVLYLHVKYGLSQTKIAEILSRDHTTIWTTLENALAKISIGEYKKIIASLEETGLKLVPVKVLGRRNLSILESVALYLKERFSLSYHEIALILGKNDRTIWTVIDRARKKGFKQKGI